MPESLPSSDAALVLRRKASRTATWLWLVVHVPLLAAVGIIGAPAYVKIVLAVALWVHVVVRWPERGPHLAHHGAGQWAIPERGEQGLRLGGRTRYTRRWVRLDLIDRCGRSRMELVWADEVDPSSWRRLQLLLREPVPEAGAMRSLRG